MAARRGNRSLWIRLGVVTVFAVAMAYLEAATVVYLRTIFHITGDLLTFAPKQGSIWFSLPYFTLLKPTALARVLPRASIASVEVAREAATVVMLLALGWLSGRNLKTRAAYFFYAFGVWDLGYYAFLRLLVGWPSSLRSLDVLFLIPGPWVAPVFVPMLLSAAMVVVSAIVLRREG